MAGITQEEWSTRIREMLAHIALDHRDVFCDSLGPVLGAIAILAASGRSTPGRIQAMLDREVTKARKEESCHRCAS